MSWSITRKRNRPRADNRQGVMDFDRGERLQLLDEVPIASGLVTDGQSTVAVSAATARSVLRAIESHARESHQCWASATTIGREISRHERTVRRAIMYLETLSFAIVEKREGRSMVCRINWSEIGLATWKTSESRRAKEASIPLANPGHPDANPGHPDANHGHYVRRSVSKRKKKRTPPYAPPSRDGWDEVASRLRDVGVVRWRALLNELSKAGVIDADHAIEIIDHYQASPGAWTPVALVERLRSAHPDTEAAELWWTPMEAWPSSEAIRAEIRQANEERDVQLAKWIIDAAVARKLSKTGLRKCITKSEAESLKRLEEQQALMGAR